MRLSRFFAVVVACFMVAGTAAQATEIEDINAQYRRGDLSGALERTDRYLEKNPQDAQARFIKGLILGDQGRTADAIGVFSALTEDYPELPEPYNNLAVLHASQNNYAAAQDALERAILAHPDYATAHENLGDIHAALAARAYGRALALDAKNASARNKQALIGKMIGSAQQPSTRPAAAQPAATAQPVPEKTAATDTAGVEAAVARWARAWSARDVEAYLAAYASDFAADGMRRADWVAERRKRIRTPATIDVQVSELRVERRDDVADASFVQAYRSGRLNTRVNKTLTFARRDGEWRIVGESSR